MEQTTLSIESEPPHAVVAQRPDVRAVLLELMASAILTVHRAHHAREREREEGLDDDART